MTSSQDPTGGTGPQGENEDAPGWGLPSAGPEPTGTPKSAGDDDAPLTALQQAVVNEVAEGQRALGDEMKWSRRSRLDLIGGYRGGLVGSEVDSVLASQAARRVSECELEAQFLAGATDAVSDTEPHFPAGGPPTPEEVHEAEMHPWPHHGMAETIEHNRALRQNPAAAGDGNGLPDAPPGTS